MTYQKLIASPRVSPQTRAILTTRSQPDALDYRPSALTAEQLRTLRAIIARVLPQAPEPSEVVIDIAARIDTELAVGKGDGWRYASLPSDIEAYRTGLSLLADCAVKLQAKPFDELPANTQDTLLASIATDQLGSAHFDMKRWFEDLCDLATQLYVAHPQTLAQIGYSGIADNEGGFVQLGIGERESWEPEPQLSEKPQPQAGPQ